MPSDTQQLTAAFAELRRAHADYWHSRGVNLHDPSSRPTRPAPKELAARREAAWSAVETLAANLANEYSLENIVRHGLTKIVTISK